MANEERKDFNAMLRDSRDMPKIQIITDRRSIEKYGGDRMYFAPPADYDRVMRLVPPGKLLTVGQIRDYFARGSGWRPRDIRSCRKGGAICAMW